MDFRKIVTMALREDRASRDVTTGLLPPRFRNLEARAVMAAKAEGVVCGTRLAAAIFTQISPSARIKILIPDGKPVAAGDKILIAAAPLSALLAAERTALNFAQRLSGIATLTARFVSIAKPFGVEIYDTRKTTPGLRALEKYAVLSGGGKNHRNDLADMILVKDNHLAAVPDPAYWVRAARKKHGRNMKIEIECDTPSGACRAAAAAPDAVLLDNMPLPALAESIRAVRKMNPRITIEVSGSVRLVSVGKIALLRPDRISVGALTHSAPALDISLEISV